MGFRTVGLTAGASTPYFVIEETRRRLEFVLNARHLGVITPGTTMNDGFPAASTRGRKMQERPTVPNSPGPVVPLHVADLCTPPSCSTRR